jgi:DNA-binding beta-propeller fold protein YncE
VTVLICTILTTAQAGALAGPQDPVERRLYVADRTGLTIYDIDHGHKELRKIAIPDSGDYKGICGDAKGGKLYLSSRLGEQLVCLDLVSERVDWRMKVEGYPDSLSITPDGRFIYLPRREGGDCLVVDTRTQGIVSAIKLVGKPHNTWPSRDGKWMYLSALENPSLTLIDVSNHKVIRTIGPFQAAPGRGIRPFAITADDRLAYVNVDDLLGFEIGEVATGKRLGRVQVKGFEPLQGWHRTTSHGINIRPDQREVWLSNDAGDYLHVFDITKSPPEQMADIKLRGPNGWVTFGLSGDYCYPSSGDVIDARSKRVVGNLGFPIRHARDGREKLLEVRFRAGRPAEAGTR